MMEAMDRHEDHQALADELQELALLRDDMAALARQLETEVLVMQLDVLLIDRLSPRGSATRALAPAPCQLWHSA